MGTGDVTKTHIAWALKRGAPRTFSNRVGDELYVVNDGGIATCLDARSATLVWQQRLGGTYSASPVFADGRIYFLAEQGVTTVIAPAGNFDGWPPIRWMAACSHQWRFPAALFLRTDNRLVPTEGSDR